MSMPRDRYTTTRTGQGPYGGYSQGYAPSFPASRNLFPSQGGMFGSGTYESSRFGNVSSGLANRFNYGMAPPVQYYGFGSYYQPSYGPVYVPFQYQGY